MGRWIRPCGSSSCLEASRVDGVVFLRNTSDPDGPTVIASVSEWEQFVAGAKRGEFDSLTGPAAVGYAAPTPSDG